MGNCCISLLIGFFASVANLGLYIFPRFANTAVALASCNGVVNIEPCPIPTISVSP